MSKAIVKYSAAKVEWVKMSARGDWWQKDSSRSKRKGLQEGSEACYDAWFGNSALDKKKKKIYCTKDVEYWPARQEE